MPAKPRKIPSYRLHKPSGQAVVRLDGRDHYLGKHGSEASHELYRRKVAEWLAVGIAAASTGHEQPPQPRPASDLSVGEMILAFWTTHAETYYRRPDGSQTGELANFRDALRPLSRLYGHTPAAAFGPLNLKAVRQSMIDSGLCRNVINQRVGKVARVFKWAASVELLPVAVYQSLRTVQGLARGRSDARETGPVRPVPHADIEAILPHVSSQVRAMVRSQLLSGMRPEEVTMIRGRDLDTSGVVWVYTPWRHKTEHHGKDRRIYLGPQAQAVLRPFLKADGEAYLFSPAEAAAELWARRRRERKSPMTPSQAARSRRSQPCRTPGATFDTRAYAHAIHRACKKAGVPVWGPNRLRHNAATSLRAEFGLDVARAVLGHDDAGTTTIYAERDGKLAATAMERQG